MSTWRRIEALCIPDRVAAIEIMTTSSQIVWVVLAVSMQLSHMALENSAPDWKPVWSLWSHSISCDPILVVWESSTDLFLILWLCIWNHSESCLFWDVMASFPHWSWGQLLRFRSYRGTAAYTSLQLPFSSPVKWSSDEIDTCFLSPPVPSQSWVLVCKALEVLLFLFLSFLFWVKWSWRYFVVAQPAIVHRGFVLFFCS